MPGIVEDLAGRPFLHQRPGVEHAHPVAHAGDDRKVVADEQDGCRKLAAQAGDQVEHLGFHSGVEAGRGLVQDQQPWIDRESHGDGDALLHAAGQLMGITLQHRAGIGDLHAAQHALGPVLGLAFAQALEAEDLVHLAPDA